MHMPLPEEVIQVFSTQHWISAGPGQYPATWKPPVVQDEVARHVPAPYGVEHVPRSKRLRGSVGVVVTKERVARIAAKVNDAMMSIRRISR